MTEIYKDIVDYEGLYQVSNLGNIKSLPKGNGNGYKERLLALEVVTKNHTTYRRVTLSKEGEVKRYQVHQLVAQAFIPNPDNKPAVNHIDNDGSNNTVLNLEWCTLSENMQHSSGQGRQDLTRYLGGKASGKKRFNESVEAGRLEIGNTYGNLTIIDYFYDTSLQRPRFKYKCKCSCGNTTDKNKHDLHSKLQMCKECAYKVRAATRKSNKDKDIVSTV